MKIICIVALIQNILYSNVSKHLSTERTKNKYKINKINIDKKKETSDNNEPNF